MSEKKNVLKDLTNKNYKKVNHIEDTIKDTIKEDYIGDEMKEISKMKELLKEWENNNFENNFENNFNLEGDYRNDLNSVDFNIENNFTDNNLIDNNFNNVDSQNKQKLVTFEDPIQKIYDNHIVDNNIKNHIVDNNINNHIDNNINNYLKYKEIEREFLILKNTHISTLKCKSKVYKYIYNEIERIERQYISKIEDLKYYMELSEKYKKKIDKYEKNLSEFIEKYKIEVKEYVKGYLEKKLE